MITPARLALVERIMENLEGAVTRAVEHHNALLIEGANRIEVGSNYSLKSELLHKNLWHDGVAARVTGRDVAVLWEDYVRGCKVGGGEFNIPSAALCDATYKEAIQRIVAAKLDEIAARLTAWIEHDRREKQRQFDRLKKELGQ